MRKFIGVAVLLFSISTVYAANLPADSALPDVMVESFYFSECDEKTIEDALKVYGTLHEIIYKGEDKTFFDMRAINTDAAPTPGVERTFCYTYVVRNIGNAEVKANDRLGEYFYITNEHDVHDKLFTNGDTVSKALRPGESYIGSGHIRVELNTHQDDNCISMRLILNGISKSVLPPAVNEAAEFDVTNNASLLCYEVWEYVFPNTPQNVKVLYANGKNVELTWDPVRPLRKKTDADSYEITGVNVSFHKFGDLVYFNKVKDTKISLRLPDNDFYCLNVVAANNGFTGDYSAPICYSAALQFYDYSSSEYFRYFRMLFQLMLPSKVDG